jgi:hypothetical protein
MRMVWMLCGVTLLALPAARTDAAVFCKKKNGAVVIRETCKSKETAVNLASFGAVGPKGDKGDNGNAGDPGAAGPLLTTLASGQTMRGAFGIGETASAASQVTEGPISFPFPLASNPTVQVIQEGALTPAGCSGDFNAPGAEPGNFCIFVGFANGNTQNFNTYGTDGFDDYRHGAVVYTRSVGAGTFEGSGTWAVTAP